METTIILNNSPIPIFVFTTFFICVKKKFYTILFVAMFTKFNNLSQFFNFVAMETTVVLHNFPKTNILLLGPGLSFVVFF